MNKRRVLLALVSLICLGACWPAGAQEMGTRVTIEQLQNRIQATQDAADLDDEGKTRLIDLYRQSINNLESIRVNDELAEEFRQANRTAPRETEKVRATIERRRDSDPLASISVSESTDIREIVRKLEEELANKTAVEAKLAVLDARLESEGARPATIRARIAAARSAVARLASQAGDAPAGDVSAQLQEARRWARETRLEALQAEILMLDRELLSYNARNVLLRAQREEQAQSLQRIQQRSEALSQLANSKRREEADRAIAQAQAVLDSATTDEPLLRELADANLKLVKLLDTQVAELDVVGKRESARPRTAQIEAAFRSARRKLELDAAGAPVGLAILQERADFPAARELAAERRKISGAITAVSLRLIEAQEERETLADVSQFVDRRVQERSLAEVDSAVRQELTELAKTRRNLLDRTIANDAALQRRLYDLNDALERLVNRLGEYDKFLAERLLWVKSTRLADAEEWARLPDELSRYLSPSAWASTARLAAQRLFEAPASLLLVLAAFFTIFRRRAFAAALVESGSTVGRIREDSMAPTFRAVGYTVLLAAPLPLLMVGIGRGLSTAPAGSVFDIGIGIGLERVGFWLASLLLLVNVFRSDGLGGRHFGWDRDTLKDLRRVLRLFIAIAIPVFFVSTTSNLSDQLTGAFGGILSMATYCLLMITVFWLNLRIGHPTRGAVRRVLAAHPESRWWRWRYLWFPVILLVPLIFVLLAYIGFDYTAGMISQGVFQSIALVIGIWLGAALVRRWLLMTNRRLAFNKALAELEAARARQAGEDQPEQAEGDIGEPEIDLVALDTDSRQLLNATVLLLIALGLFAVWDDVIPAFGVFEQIRLWNKTALVEGVEQLVPVTLTDLLLAVVVGIGGYVLATNLPSLLNIILLKQGSVTAGGRYTVQTLTKYTIVAVAVLLVLNILGVRAAQLGWAAAALGVGIGFGLQEIVANFICGLILLFERPIRVGDVITVGDASGVVNKIRIRATTIRDWEQKELVIPNKELITGRLLNWTLSDAMTRITIVIGVAYGSDTERAMQLMCEAADECPTVLNEPAPFAHFEQFGESTLNLTLRIFVGSTSERLASQTDVLSRIDRKFKAAGIVIAFPQRDVHIYQEQIVPPMPGQGSSG